MERAIRLAMSCLVGIAACKPAASQNAFAGLPASELVACPAVPAPPAVSRILYTGATSAAYGDEVPLEAMLVDGRGAPIANAAVQFALAGQTATASTDGSGVARGSLPATAAPGDAAVVVSYAGDASHPAARSAGSVDIERADTMVRYSGSTALPGNVAAQVSATLVASEDTPVAGRAVAFQVGGVSAHAVTGPDGVATATMSLPARENNGASVIFVAFAGDAGYKESASFAVVSLYQQTQFVVWGGNAGGLSVGAGRVDLSFIWRSPSGRRCGG